MRDIYPESAAFFEDDINISEDSQRGLKTSEDVLSLASDTRTKDICKRRRNLDTIAEAETALTFPSPSLRMCVAKCNLAPGAFCLNKVVLSFTQCFHFLHQFEFTYIWILHQAKLQPLKFFNQA